MLTPAPGLLVSFEGIDASGKSTIARSLVERLIDEGHDAILLDRHTAVAAVDGYLADHLAGLRRLIWEYPPDAVTSRLGFAHWAQLISAWFHAVDHTVVRPALADGRWVVADSWFYKFAARFTLTVGPAAALVPFEGVIRPQASIWLDVDPRECLGRRAELRSTESGEWQGLASGADAFVSYQGQVGEVYREFAAADGWLTLGTAGEAQTVDRALRHLLIACKELT